MSAHLWEIDHPYYCNESNYYAPAGGTFEHDSWAEFYSEWGEGDNDLNLVFRWDWERANPSDYEPGEEIPGDTLHVFFMLQRKGNFVPVAVQVTEADEPQVREWLVEKAAHLRTLWEPFL